MAVATDKVLKELIQGVGGIDTSGLAKDTTLQAVVNALQNLQIDVNQSASNVSYDNTTSGLSASNVQGAIDEVNNLVKKSTASITRQSGVSSNVPIPQITRRGNEVIVHFAHQFPAGTYQQLYEVTPTPASEQHAIVALGNNIIIVHLSTSGRIRFNSQQTISATSYLIGQLVYLTDE